MRSVKVWCVLKNSKKHFVSLIKSSSTTVRVLCRFRFVIWMNDVHSLCRVIVLYTSNITLLYFKCQNVYTYVFTTTVALLFHKGIEFSLKKQINPRNELCNIFIFLRRQLFYDFTYPDASDGMAEALLKRIFTTTDGFMNSCKLNSW